MSRDLGVPWVTTGRDPPISRPGSLNHCEFWGIHGATLLALSPVETGSRSPQAAAAGLGVRLSP